MFAAMVMDWSCVTDLAVGVAKLEQFWTYAALIALGLWCFVSVLLAAVRLPGTWMILAGGALYGWWADWVGVTSWVIVALASCAVVGEIVELLSSVVTARRAGASRRAAWGGMLGSILGMIFLSFLIPIPVVGTVAGGLLGCFAGAMAAELSSQKTLAHGSKVGFFSALGYVFGMVAKMAVALTMAAILLTFASVAVLGSGSPIQ